jgi:signal transduction histidine kinase
VKMGSCSLILLLSLIEDILDLSKMEAGTFAIFKEDMMIPELIDEVYDIFSTQCKQRNIELIFDIQSYLSHVKFNSDRGRVKQILLNLMSNATKFTFNGRIKISAQIIKINNMHYVEF